VFSEKEPLYVSGGHGGFFQLILESLGRADDPRVAEVVLAYYSKLQGTAKAAAIDLLTRRPIWAQRLLAAIAAKKLAAHEVSVNHARKLLALKDPSITKSVWATWGILRDERNPAREHVVNEMRALLSSNVGDAQRGATVYKTVCAQCHKFHGAGEDVGPG